MEHAGRRQAMVEEQLRARGVTNERLLEAMRRVPRHQFVPAEYQALAYEDHPVPIGCGQTTSQPYMIALMVDALRLRGDERVLEIGTGSGYQTAILSALAREVYSVERVPDLLEEARERLAALGCGNVRLCLANGSLGWPGEAPYDGIIVSAAAPRMPSPLPDQLAEGGRLVVPIGDPTGQRLLVVERRQGAYVEREVAGCMFVPLIGRHGWPDARH